MATKTKYRGVILYRGPSLIDGKPIVAIATLKTTNRKTGDMIQTWILRDDISPIAAINSGEDESVCGSCTLRGVIAIMAKNKRDKLRKRLRKTNKNRGCYVTVRNAPTQIYKSLKRGNYPVYNATHHSHLFRSRKLRLGSYGDPVAVPYGVWKPLVDLSTGHTGYTHQWREGRFWRFKRLLMASTETHKDTEIAKSKNWRVFQSLQPDTDLSTLPKGLAICPASPEGGERRQCATCMGCNGAGNNPQRVSFAIVAHGSKATMSGYKRQTATTN